MVEEIICDLTNGTSRYDILKKISEGLYEGNNGITCTTANARRYITMAYKELAKNREGTMEELRDLFWTRFEEVYKEALEIGNLQVANTVIKDMMKIYGLDTPQKVEVKVEPIKLNWGFNNEEEQLND